MIASHFCRWWCIGVQSLKYRFLFKWDLIVFLVIWPWWRHQMETFSALLAICSPHKGQWRGALMFTLICARINGWVNNREAGDLRRYRAHYDVIVMYTLKNYEMNACIGPGCHSFYVGGTLIEGEASGDIFQTTQHHIHISPGIIIDAVIHRWNEICTSVVLTGKIKQGLWKVINPEPNWYCGHGVMTSRHHDQ